MKLINKEEIYQIINKSNILTKNLEILELKEK